MKFIFFILLFFPLCFYSQQRTGNNYAIDDKVKYIPFSKVDSLAIQLSALGNTDREKVRAIFRWITEHIDYNVIIFNRNKNNPRHLYEEPDDSLSALPSLNERVAAKVLDKRIAFCDGYCRLFKTLCDYAGVRNEIITGYARTNVNKSGRFAVNHTWNAVYLDSAWYLLDVTWASGYVSYANEFVRQYNDFYFLTPPQDFIRDHYPEDIQWTLLTDPPVYREFNKSPFRYSGYIKSGVSSYFPAKGVIEISPGDSVQIGLKTTKGIKNFFVAESLAIDSSQNVSSPGYILNGDKSSVTYKSTSAAGEWLYVFCNNELVMRYKLNIKRDTRVANQQGY